MAISKYKNKSGYDVNVSPFLYKGCDQGIIDFKIVVTKGNKRLDHYAFEEYTNSSYWWIIAACSGIGWPLQVPNGIELRIPKDLEQVERLIGEL